MAALTGWAGKILRVNLSTGAISTVDTRKYTDFIGGMGIGYKVIFDEVPVGTKAYEPANKIIFAVGPLTGAGALCSGRTNVTTLSPLNPYSAVADSHFGGYWGSELKYAGYDAVIVEGKAPYPVWIRIEDDKVTIENARHLWGKGTFDTQAAIGGIMGKEAHVACIGPAGENLVPNSFIRTGESHHGGGHGGVLGSKNLKAIGVKGTGAVHIAGTSAEWNKIVRENLAVIGANNNHVVPATPQPWAEYTAPTRWTASKGRFWGAAVPPVETGTCDPHDVNSIGYRTLKSIFDLGNLAEKYTVRMGGCASCPIRCHSQLKIPALEQFGYSPYVASTCVGFSGPGAIMFKGAADVAEPGDGSLMAKALGAQITNDLGVWCQYSQLPKDLEYAYSTGILKKVLPADEYKDIRFDLLEAKDVRFLIDFYTRIAYQKGEFCHIGDGIYNISKRWNFGEDYFNDKKWTVWSRTMGFPKHHSNEAGCGQTGTLISMVKNRDAQNHSHMNFIGSGLPVAKQKEVAAEIWGSPDAVDGVLDYTPVNPSKVKFAKWSLVKLALHDSLTLCNWMWPMTVSPLKERNYRGNLKLESQYYSVATGNAKSEAELDFDAERILHLHRALTELQMGTKDMRKTHDALPEWIFTEDPDKKPFTKGTDKMDRADMEKAIDMFYDEMGWDKATGAVTKATLLKFGLADVAAALDKKGLLV
jgi:aldehyde:ferredoxin oxidoreductase